MELSERELGIISRYRRELGILQNVEPDFLRVSDLNVVVACGDGDQRDLFDHHHRLHNAPGKTSRIHLICANGGALWLAKEFKPLEPAQLHAREFITQQIQESLKLKGAGPLVLYVHTPCGAAQARGLQFEDVMRLLYSAKVSIKEELKLSKVLCLFHVDYGGCKKKTYHCCMEKYRDYMGIRNRFDVHMPDQSHVGARLPECASDIRLTA